MPVTGLPDDHTLQPGAIPVPAGKSLEVQDADGVRMDLRCPADGEACVVIPGEYGFESTDGTPHVVPRYNQLA